ncbi:MAG: type II toxin-antitoxin system ParD family antitoxin [Candidatus Scalindua sp.]|nr:type II toxin-antitoxin system ParD family antitoxin [Candidatus Scalindua sp.]MCR4345453.1 type II toxin-antitoxin system ParD family antitoxin [Candidatus Scalindua sp.]
MKDNEKAEKICITIPPDMLMNIKGKVKSGSYGSTSEVIREAVRVWQKQEDEYQARLLLIRDRLERSSHSGKPVPLDRAFKQIEHLHQQRMDMVGNEDL